MKGRMHKTGHHMMTVAWMYLQVVQDGALPLKKEDIRFTSVSVLSAYDKGQQPLTYTN